MLHPLLANDSKQKEKTKKTKKNGATVRREREKGGRKGREGGEWGLFSVSVTSMTQIFHRLSKSPHCSRSSTGSFACLKFNGGRADVHMRTLALGHMKACTHAKMKQTHRQQLHEPNKFVEDPRTLILKSEMRICHSLKAKIQLKSDSGSERGEAVYQNAPTPSSFICSVSISALTLC